MNHDKACWKTNLTPMTRPCNKDKEYVGIRRYPLVVYFTFIIHRVWLLCLEQLLPHILFYLRLCGVFHFPMLQMLIQRYFLRPPPPRDKQINTKTHAPHKR